MPVKRASLRNGWRRSKPDSHNEHSKKYPQVVRDIIKTSDIILEILDARAIDKTRNHELEKLIEKDGKKLIRIINKVDLIDISELKKNKELGELEPYVLYSFKKKIGKAKLQEMIKIEAKRSKAPFPRKRVGIIGYPNLGKSSIINSLVGGRKATASSTMITLCDGGSTSASAQAIMPVASPVEKLAVCSGAGTAARLADWHVTETD